MRIPSATLGLLVAGATFAFAAGDKPHWTYEGAEGPDRWGDLSADYAACRSGTQQSPVDIAGPVDADLDDIDLNWNAGEWVVLNNGHTIQVQGPKGGKATIEGEEYELLQFHFHTPSEHTIGGRRFAMEVHFVHAHEDGRLAVIGVMMEGGGDNDLFTSIMAAAPGGEGEAPLGTGDATALMPSDDSVLRYQGSLTTPPCSEVVLWTVMDTPIQVSQADIDAFAKLFPNNARPLQPLNRRFTLKD